MVEVSAPSADDAAAVEALADVRVAPKLSGIVQRVPAPDVKADQTPKPVHHPSSVLGWEAWSMARQISA